MSILPIPHLKYQYLPNQILSNKYYPNFNNQPLIANHLYNKQYNCQYNKYILIKSNQQSNPQVIHNPNLIMEQQPSTRILACIDKVSTKPRYQIVLIVYICLLWIVLSYMGMVSWFTFMNPLFECNGLPVTELEACSRMADVGASLSDADAQCRIVNDYTATYYDRFYCERKHTRSAIQSIYSLGCIVGMFLLPGLADAKGRKFSVLIGYGIAITGISSVIAGIYQNTPQLILFGQFMNGTFGAGIVVLTYILAGQFCSDSARQKAILVFNAVSGLADISFYFLYTYMPQWTYYMLYLIGMPLVVIAFLAFFIVCQTPNYCLIMAKSPQKFNKSIEKIAKWNKALISEIEQAQKMGLKIYKKIQQKQQTQKHLSQCEVIFHIFTSKRTLVPCICLAISQLGYNVFSMGIQGSLERTGFNFGVNMALVGINQFIGFLLVGTFVTRIKRKKWLIGTILITCMLGLSFLFKFIDQSQILQSILLSATRQGIVLGYSLVTLLETQSFPIEIRSTAMGVTKALSQSGKIGVPYLITQMNDIGMYPIVAVSILYLVLGIIPLFFVKETWKKWKPSPLLAKSSQEIEIGSQIINS